MKNLRFPKLGAARGIGNVKHREGTILGGGEGRLPGNGEGILLAG